MSKGGGAFDSAAGFACAAEGVGYGRDAAGCATAVCAALSCPRRGRPLGGPEDEAAEAPEGLAWGEVVRCAECAATEVPDAFAVYCSRECLAADAPRPNHRLVHANLRHIARRLATYVAHWRTCDQSTEFTISDFGPGRGLGLVALRDMSEQTVLYIEDPACPPLRPAIYLDPASAPVGRTASDPERAAMQRLVGRRMEIALQV